MEVKIRIDGVLIDGVTPDSVKLNINNPDPLKFTDPTVSYTASISLPRTETTTGCSSPSAFLTCTPVQPHTLRSWISMALQRHLEETLIGHGYQRHRMDIRLS